MYLIGFYNAYFSGITFKRIYSFHNALQLLQINLYYRYFMYSLDDAMHFCVYMCVCVHLRYIFHLL